MIQFNKIENNQEKIRYDDSNGEPLNTGFADVLKDYFKDQREEEELKKEVEDNESIQAILDDVGKASTTSEIKFSDMFKDIDEMTDEELVEEDDDIPLINDDELDAYNEEDVVYKSALDNYIFIPKERWELSAFEKWLIKKHPEKYKLGVDPRIENKLRQEKLNKKKNKRKKKLENMSEEQKETYLKEKERKKQLKIYNSHLKQFNNSNSKKMKKKERRLEEKIRIAYRKQMKDSQENYKNLKDFIIKKEFQAYKDDIGIGKKNKIFDPYARYRKKSNIISVAEAEAFESDFKNSFVKNLEMELMEKLNTPIDIGGQTVVEYYDKKGRLRSKEIMDDDHISKKDKKKKKKDKKKDKKREKKYINSVLSPNYKDF